MSIPDDLVSSKEAARLIKVSVNSIYRWRENGTLRGYRVAGTRYRFSRRDVLALVEELDAEPAVTTAREDEEAAAAAVERMRRAGHRV